MQCPLCKSNNIEIIEIVPEAVLKRLCAESEIPVEHLLYKDIELRKCCDCDLRFYYPLITGDEFFYNALQKSDWYYMDDKEEYVYAKQFVRETDKVLEVGSGKGAFAKYLLTKDYTGLEFSREAKKIAAQYGVKIENESIEEHSKKYPGYYDVVCSFQVLEHVSDPYSFLNSQKISLKKDGLLIAAVPSEDSYLRYVQDSILNMPPHHVTRWSDVALKGIAKLLDLQIIDIYHEKVQDIHLELYRKTLVAFWMKSKFDIKHKELSTVKDRFINRIARFLSRVIAVDLPNEFRANGHTVIAVYKNSKT